MNDLQIKWQSLENYAEYYKNMQFDVLAKRFTDAANALKEAGSTIDTLNQTIEKLNKQIEELSTVKTEEKEGDESSDG